MQFRKKPITKPRHFHGQPRKYERIRFPIKQKEFAGDWEDIGAGFRGRKEIEVTKWITKKIPTQKLLPKEELIQLISEARKGNRKAKLQLQRFYIKEIEMRILKKFGEIENQREWAYHIKDEPYLLTEMAFRSALDKWISKNRKFNLKTFSNELTEATSEEIKRLRDLLKSVKVPTGDMSFPERQFESAFSILFPEFINLKKRNENMEEFRQLFGIALYSVLRPDRLFNYLSPDAQSTYKKMQPIVVYYTRRQLGKILQREMKSWREKDSRILRGAASFERPLKGREGKLLDKLAGNNDHAFRSFQVLLPMTQNHQELARQHSFARQIWSQLKPTKSRRDYFEQWKSGSKPRVVTIWHSDGTKTIFKEPGIQGLKKIYRTWIQKPGQITVRWQMTDQEAGF